MGGGGVRTPGTLPLDPPLQIHYVWIPNSYVMYFGCTDLLPFCARVSFIIFTHGNEIKNISFNFQTHMQ